MSDAFPQISTQYIRYGLTNEWYSCNKTSVVLSVIIVACSLFLSMCLFVRVNCLLNAFAICVGEVTVLSVRVIALL